MNRIVIVGSGGSGKSTAAKQLGLALSLEVIHLDRLFWKPGWVRVPPPEQEAIIQEIISRPSWIIDGDHLRTQPLRFAAADTILFLDFPRCVCLWRTVKRFFQHWRRSRPGMAEGCPERLSWLLLQWVWRYPTDTRPQVMENIRQYAEGRQVIALRGPRDVPSFLCSLINTR